MAKYYDDNLNIINDLSFTDKNKEFHLTDIEDPGAHITIADKETICDSNLYLYLYGTKGNYKIGNWKKRTSSFKNNRDGWEEICDPWIVKVNELITNINKNNLKLKIGINKLYPTKEEQLLKEKETIIQYNRNKSLKDSKSYQEKVNILLDKINNNHRSKLSKLILDDLNKAKKGEISPKLTTIISGLVGRKKKSIINGLIKDWVDDRRNMGGYINKTIKKRNSMKKNKIRSRKNYKKKKRKGKMKKNHV